MERVYSVQVLRFFAAALVAALHINQSAHWQAGLDASGILPNIGSFGVDVFFVISGFIIAKTAPGHSPRSFFARRFARVVPFYWIMTALYVPLLIYVGMFNWLGGFATVTFYPGLSRPWLGVGWTLCFEMLFYCSTALILFNPRRLLPLALGIYAACWIARLYIGGPFQFFGNPIILEFLAGAALAQTRAKPLWVGLIAIAASIAWMVPVALNGIGYANWVRFIVDGQFALERLWFMGIPAALVVFGVMQIQMKEGLLTYLGDASYSIYLTHRHCIVIVRSLTHALPLWLFTPATALLALSLSVIMYELVEKQSVAWAKRMLSAKQVKRPSGDVPARGVAVADSGHGTQRAN